MGGWNVLDATGSLKVVGTVGPTGPTGPTGASGGGGAGSITEGAFATRSATGPTGTTFLPTDGFAASYHNGTNWVGFGPLHYLGAEPVDPGTWVNQSSATLETGSGALTLIGPATGTASTNIIARVGALGTTGAYTVTAFLRGFMAVRLEHQMGMCLRDSATGKMVVFGLYADNGVASGVAGRLYWEIAKYTNATAGTGPPYFESVSAVPWTNGMWLRITDDNTNRKCSVSVDGQHWTQMHSVGRADFITPDQYGFYISNTMSVGTGAQTGTFTPTLQVLSLSKT